MCVAHFPIGARSSPTSQSAAIQKLKNIYFEFCVRTVCQIPETLSPEERPIWLAADQPFWIKPGSPLLKEAVAFPLMSRLVRSRQRTTLW